MYPTICLNVMQSWDVKFTFNLSTPAMLQVEVKKTWSCHDWDQGNRLRQSRFVQSYILPILGINMSENSNVSKVPPMNTIYKCNKAFHITNSETLNIMSLITNNVSGNEQFVDETAKFFKHQCKSLKQWSRRAFCSLAGIWSAGHTQWAAATASASCIHVNFTSLSLNHQ